MCALYKAPCKVNLSIAGGVILGASCAVPLKSRVWWKPIWSGKLTAVNNKRLTVLRIKDLLAPLQGPKRLFISMIGRRSLFPASSSIVKKEKSACIDLRKHAWILLTWLACCTHHLGFTAWVMCASFIVNLGFTAQVYNKICASRNFVVLILAVVGHLVWFGHFI